MRAADLVACPLSGVDKSWQCYRQNSICCNTFCVQISISSRLQVMNGLEDSDFSESSFDGGSEVNDAVDAALAELGLAEPPVDTAADGDGAGPSAAADEVGEGAEGERVPRDNARTRASAGGTGGASAGDVNEVDDNNERVDVANGREVEAGNGGEGGEGVTLPIELKLTGMKADFAKWLEHGAPLPTGSVWLNLMQS